MTSPILFAGSEDISFAVPQGFLSGSPTWTAGGTPIYIVTTAGQFRSGYSRCGLAVMYNGTSTSFPLSTPSGLWSQTSFWTSFYVYLDTIYGTGATACTAVVFYDVNGVARLRIQQTAAGVLQAQTLTSSGTAVQIGSNFSTLLPSNSLVKVDIYVSYGTSGTFNVFFNRVPVFAFSGDVTAASGLTVLGSRVDMGVWAVGESGYYVYSEVINATVDTRNLNLVTQAPGASGNSGTFTSGAYSNVNPIVGTVTTPDYSSTASQLQEYEVTPTLPTGNFSILSVVHHIQATIGSSGPQHMYDVVRTGSTDYTSSSLAPTTAWGLIQNNWDTNPNTSAAWTPAQLASLSTTFNMGYESVT